MESNKVTIAFTIESCKNCPFFDMKRHYTPDSFEMCFDWICKKYNNMIIACVETFEKEPGIPDWCPILTKQENKKDECGE